MGVTIRKRGGKWYVFVNYHGQRKAKCIGANREIAEQVRRQLEARLALGDLGFLEAPSDFTFERYAQRWLKQHAEVELKSSTVDFYTQFLRLYVLPRFGQSQLKADRAESSEGFLGRIVGQR